MRLRRSTNEVCRVSESSDSHSAAFGRPAVPIPPAPFDSDDAIVPPSLEHVTRDARRPKEALNHPNVVLEPLGRDPRDSHHASAEDDVVEDGRGVSRGAAAEHAPGPPSGTHLDGRTQPCGSALVADERAERISRQLNDFDVAQHPLVDALRRCRGPLEPSREGIAGMARDPGGRRNAHTLDAPARDLVEFPPSAATAAVRCPRVRADRSPAARAAVPPASAPLRRTRAVAHDVEAQLSTGVTPALGAGHPVDRVHRSSVPGGNPRFSPKISEVKATDQQRPAQAPVIGISATLDRFTELLDAVAQIKKARTHQRVDVSPTDVIESGLLKAKVVLYHPEGAKASDYPLLREAVRQWRTFESRWASYCAAQEEYLVQPILLVQVEDGSKSRLSNTDLGAVVSAIRDEAGELDTLAFAHAFQDGTAIALDDGTTVRYLAPSAIDRDRDVRVVLFKTSLNTGWDCPRAEVMMSFRPAKDATFIAQLVGRMVRTPLARAVEQDEVLNSVALMLPRFDEAEVGKVIRYLTDGDIGPTKVETNRERFILAKPPDINDCLDALTGLPTYLVPRAFGVSEVQRVAQLADALSQSALKPEAASETRECLVNVLRTLIKIKLPTSSRV